MNVILSRARISHSVIGILSHCPVVAVCRQESQCGAFLFNDGDGNDGGSYDWRGGNRGFSRLSR